MGTAGHHPSSESAMSRRHRSDAKRRRRHGSENELDRLLPDVGNGAAAPGLRPPPALIVQGPEDAARRRARDERDGVAVANPRRRVLAYLFIAVFVALLVFAVLALIETRELPAALPR
jgi:hypothetical protein